MGRGDCRSRKLFAEHRRAASRNGSRQELSEFGRVGGVVLSVDSAPKPADSSRFSPKSTPNLNTVLNEKPMRLQGFIWSGRRESNPHIQLGKRSQPVDLSDLCSSSRSDERNVSWVSKSEAPSRG